MGDDGVSVHICSKGCERPRSFGGKPHDLAVPAGEVSGVESPLLQIWTLLFLRATFRSSQPVPRAPGTGASSRTSEADEGRRQWFCSMTDPGRAQRLGVHHWLRMVG